MHVTGNTVKTCLEQPPKGNTKITNIFIYSDSLNIYKTFNDPGFWRTDRNINNNRGNGILTTIYSCFILFVVISSFNDLLQHSIKTNNNKNKNDDNDCIDNRKNNITRTYAFK